MKFKKIGMAKYALTRKGNKGLVVNLDPYQIKQMADDDLKHIWFFPNNFKKFKTEYDFFVYGVVGRDWKND